MLEVKGNSSLETKDANLFSEKTMKRCCRGVSECVWGNSCLRKAMLNTQQMKKEWRRSIAKKAMSVLPAWLLFSLILVLFFFFSPFD